MGLLGAHVAVAALAGATLAACYEPRVRDCALTCRAASDCAGDQACQDGWCVTPGASCGDGDDEVDGRVTTDARELAAGPTVELRLEVKGRARVDGDLPGVTCAGPDGDCRIRIPRGSTVVLTPVDGDDQFARWRDACEGQAPTCTLTLVMNARAKAEFD